MFKLNNIGVPKVAKQLAFELPQPDHVYPLGDHGDPPPLPDLGLERRRAPGGVLLCIANKPGR